MAAEKRDHLIEQARAEYSETLERIAALERSLFDDAPRPDHRIGDSIAEPDGADAASEVNATDQRSQQVPGPPQGHADDLLLLVQLVQEIRDD
jgi:hypothetical protein